MSVDDDILYLDSFSKVSLTYDSNRRNQINDIRIVLISTGTLTYAGAMDFRDGVDAQVEYEWDSDGRMTRDGNRKIESIEYNAIDLPRRVQYKDGHIVYYTYTADGVKLKASYAFDPLNAVVDPIIGPIDGPIEGPITPINAGAPIVEPQDNPDHPVVDPGIVPETERVQSWRDYCGDHIYLNGELERILTPVGYIDSLEVHHAFVKDYRGNVRADVTEWEGVVERSDYYPYGMQMQVPWTTMRLQPYKFMGKELDRENGWDSYDVHARWLTSPIAQWTTQDPLAEANPWLSPYNYCASDPLNNTDPSGQVIEDAEDIYKRHRNNIQHNLDNIPIAKELFSSKEDQEWLDMYARELSSTLKEYDELELSEQVYAIHSLSVNSSGKDKGGYTVYNPMNGKVEAFIDIFSGENADSKNAGIISHEMKHLYQFERGNLSFNAKTGAAGRLYRLSNELEAYNRQAIIENGKDYFGQAPKYTPTIRKLLSGPIPYAYYTLCASRDCGLNVLRIIENGKRKTIIK